MDSLIPKPHDDDDEDVHWALSTSAALWGRGESAEALKWLRRAAETASDANADDRALELFKAAADVASQLDAHAAPPPAGAPPSATPPALPPSNVPPAPSTPAPSNVPPARSTPAPAPSTPASVSAVGPPRPAPSRPASAAPGVPPRGGSVVATRSAPPAGSHPPPPKPRPHGSQAPPPLPQRSPGSVAPNGQGTALPRRGALRATMPSGVPPVAPSQVPSTKASTAPPQPIPEPSSADRSGAARKPVDASRVRARAKIERRFQFPDDEVTLQRDVRSLGIKLEDLDEDTSVIESGSSPKLPPELGDAGGSDSASLAESPAAASAPPDPVSRERLSDRAAHDAASSDAPARRPSAAPSSDGPATSHDIRDEPTREAEGPSLPTVAAIRVIVSIDPEAGIVRVQPHPAGAPVPAGAASALLVPSSEPESTAIEDLFRVIGEA